MKIPNYSLTIFCLWLIALLSLANCSKKSTPEEPITPLVTDNQSKVTVVSWSGTDNNYTFNVTIKSPDTGCAQYADWWEVFTADSTLVYRRILGHSHVDEQPFTRSGGPVNIGADDFVYVRAHMNPLGYGTVVFSGSPSQGFNQDTILASLANNLLTVEPLPTDCAF